MATRTAGKPPDVRSGAVSREDFDGPARAFAEEHGWGTYYSGSSAGSANVNTSLGTMGCADLTRVWGHDDARWALIELVTMSEVGWASREGGLEVYVGYCPPGQTHLLRREPGGEPVFGEAVAGWYYWLYVGGAQAGQERGLANEADAWAAAHAAARRLGQRRAERAPEAAVLPAPAPAPVPAPARRGIFGRWGGGR
jgi:hypothetical protein